ncbi:MAG: hypothetical protein LBD99_03715 [Candidatus Margulisbacteria bacterium]|jgi:hypothetical protein|nr:hypothetical protein [Candidatus Margulisiibacteriota bacterium]
MYRKQIALEEFKQNTRANKAIGQSVINVFENLADAQKTLNALHANTATTADIQEARHKLEETRETISGQDMAVMRRNGAVTLIYTPEELAKLEDFKPAKDKLTLSEKKLTALLNELERAENDLISSNTRKFAAPLAKYAADWSVKINRTKAQESIFTQAENDFSQQHIHYEKLQEIIKSILPAEHYSAQPYYLEFNPEVRNALRAENLPAEYILTTRDGKEYFRGETPESKAALEKKIQGLILNIYEDALKETVDKNDNDIKAAYGAKSILGKNALRALAEKRASFYIQMSILNNDNAERFYDPASGATAAQWQAMAEGVLKEISKNPLKQRSLSAELYAQGEKYAARYELEWRNKDRAAPGKPQDRATQNEIIAPAKSAQKTESQVIPVSGLSYDEINQKYSEFIAGVQAASSSWQSLKTLIQNNSEILKAKSEQFYRDLATKVLPAMQKSYGENSHGKKEAEEKIKEDINALNLDKKIAAQIIADVNSYFRKAKQQAEERNKIIRRILGGAGLLLLLSLLGGGIYMLVRSRQAAEDDKYFEIIIDPSEYQNEAVSGSGNPLYEWSRNADDLDFGE